MKLPQTTLYVRSPLPETSVTLSVRTLTAEASVVGAVVTIGVTSTWGVVGSCSTIVVCSC